MVQFTSLQEYNATNAAPILSLGGDEFILFQHYSLVEVVAGDYLDLDAMRTAGVKGVRRAYFVYPIRPGIIQAMKPRMDPALYGRHAEPHIRFLSRVSNV